MKRREFLASTAMLALASPALRAASGSKFSENDYRRAIVIDACGSPGEFNPKATAGAALSPRALADVKASGMTAINITVGTVGNRPGGFESAVRSISFYEQEIVRNPGLFLKVLGGRDLQQAKASNRCGLIYGFQDTSMLEGELSRLAVFHGLGVRVVQPVYNRRNLMGDGCLEAANAGLSSLGRELIADLNRLRMLLDLSHAGARTMAEAIQASKAPMAITHTGCRALVDVPRNTHDSELRAMADKGGVAGMYFMPFLRPQGQAHAEDLIRHLDHAVNVCGEDHVGLGTDGYISGTVLDQAYVDFQRRFFERRAKSGVAAPGEAADVFNLLPDLNDARRFFSLAEHLSARGWPSRRIEKILGGNFARLFTEVWG